MKYLDKMKALIGGWRKVWQQGVFPFYFVQITPNNYNGALPFLLEAQSASIVEAAARIDAATVLVGSDKVAKPTAVRFAWKDLAQANLMNKEGLPVSVFRAEVPGDASK